MTSMKFLGEAWLGAMETGFDHSMGSAVGLLARRQLHYTNRKLKKHKME